MHAEWRQSLENTENPQHQQSTFTVSRILQAPPNYSSNRVRFNLQPARRVNTSFKIRTSACLFHNIHPARKMIY